MSAHQLRAFRLPSLLIKESRERSISSGTGSCIQKQELLCIRGIVLPLGVTRLCVCTRVGVIALCLCAYRCRCVRTYVYVQVWAYLRLCLHIRVDLIALMCTCAVRECLYIHACVGVIALILHTCLSIITLMCEYTCGSVFDGACIQILTSSCLCMATCIDMNVHMYTYACRRQPAYTTYWWA